MLGSRIGPVPIVGFDKDSTLALTSHRRPLAMEAAAGRRPWLDYSRACMADEPVRAARQLMMILVHTHRCVVMSGATECPEAREWLRQHQFPYSDVLLRPADEPETSNDALKIRWINELNRRGYRMELFVEDHPDTAAAIERETGVPVLVLNPCYPDEVDAAMEARGGRLVV